MRDDDDGRLVPIITTWSSIIAGSMLLQPSPAALVLLLLVTALATSGTSTNSDDGGGCSHPKGCWCSGSPPVPTCPPKRQATWWLTTVPAGGPLGGLTNIQFIQKHRRAVTRVAAFCWQIGDDGTFSNDEVGCSHELLGPIAAMGVELFPAGTPSKAALLNNTWHAGLVPLAEYAVAHNWTGVHVDFEEGTSKMAPGLVSEQLYAYFLQTFSSVMARYELLVEIDVGENFPVQDRKLEVDQFYLDSLGAGGRLAIMGPTYYNDPPGQNRSKDLITALTPAPHRDWAKCGPGTCGGNPAVNAMFGVQLQGAVPHHQYGWTAEDFKPMLGWVRDQGVCEIGICECSQRVATARAPS